MRGFLSQLRDRAYDVVYHGGDTSLQFIADLIRAPQGSRTSNYHTRQLQRRERAGEKRWSYYFDQFTTDERHIFLDILKRQQGEGQIAYWKRKKALLAFPNKQDLVKQYQSLERQRSQQSKNQSTQNQDTQKQKLEAEFRAITSLKNYPKHMM